MRAIGDMQWYGDIKQTYITVICFLFVSIKTILV